MLEGIGGRAQSQALRTHMRLSEVVSECRAGQLPGLAEGATGGETSEGTDAIASIEAFKVHQGGSDMSHGGSAGDRCLSHSRLLCPNLTDTLR